MIIYLLDCLRLQHVISIITEYARTLIINAPVNNAIPHFRLEISRRTARNNHPGRTKRRAIAAISQGMNTEIDSANAMMVERKARYGT